MAHYLITGGAGFIGSHLAEKLLSHGHTVTVIDDLSTGMRENIQHLEGHPNFKFVYDTILEGLWLVKLIEKADFIYHLAAAVGVELVVHSPVRTIETNVHGTERVLDLAAKHNKPVLVTSTSEVYGKSTKDRFEEDDDLLIGPTTLGRWSYACSKALDEFLALAYFKEKRLPVIVVRLFNTVGPRQTGRYGMVIPRFVQAALKNESLKVYGTGKQTRCFCHVYDTVRALTLLPNVPKSFGHVFNIGSNHEISIKALAQTVIRQTKSKSKIETVPYEKAYNKGFEDMQRRVPDITRIKKAIGWKPEYQLRQIIGDVEIYFKRQEKSAAAF